MATIQEKLANSLEVLKELQDRYNKLVIRGVGVLGETHTKRLVNAGFLQEVLRGWLYNYRSHPVRPRHHT